MIVLITGDFGVGKDTFADMLNEDFGEESVKIQSYTTREKRYNTEDTHIFVDKFINILQKLTINIQLISENVNPKTVNIFIIFFIRNFPLLFIYIQMGKYDSYN